MALHYREYPSSGKVAGYVECFWTLEGDVPDGQDAELVLPDGRPEIVWNFAAPFLRHVHGAAPRRQAASLLVGQITQPIRLRPTGGIDLVGARLRTPAFRTFLGGIPSHELTDIDVPVDDVLGSRLRAFADVARAAASSAARVRLLEDMLRADLRQAAPVDARVAAAVDLIRAAHGRTRVDDVASAVCVGVRQLERLFITEVGIGPKRLARISRFQHLVSLLRSSAPSGWAAVASRCGYYDQAHLIRDFREFTGGTPGEFLVDGQPSLTEVFLDR